MALVTQNWTLNSYTAATWTDLINDNGVNTVATLAIANPTAGALIVQVRLTDDTPTSLVEFVPPLTVALDTSEVLDLRSINVLTAQRIQIKVDAVGAEFLASGVVNI